MYGTGLEMQHNEAVNERGGTAHGDENSQHVTGIDFWTRVGE